MEYVLNVFNTALIIAIYLYIQKREDMMHQRINDVEKDMDGVRSNYNAKFQTVHAKIHETEMRIVNSLHEVESNIRSSHHKYGDDMNKALLHIEKTLSELKEQRHS